MLTKNKNKLFKSNWNKTHIKILVILSLIGLLVRLQPVISDTVHFSFDQGEDISYVRKLVKDHKLSLISRGSGLEGLFMGPLWTLILAIPYVLSGGNPAANVVFFTLLSIGSLWLAYFILRKMFSETAAILVCLYMALSNVFITASVIVLTPYPLTYLMIFYIWFLGEIVENNNQKFWPWLGLFLGLFFQFEIGFAFFLVPATLMTLFYFNKLKFPPNKTQIMGLVLFVITFLPQILFDFRHDFLMTKSLFSFFSGKNPSLGTQGMNLFERIILRTKSLWDDYSNAVSFNGNNLFATLLISIPALIGWKNIKKQKFTIYKKLLKVVFIFILSFYIGFTLYSGPIWPWYRAGLPILFILPVIIGWSAVIELNKKWKWILIAVLISLPLIGLRPKLLVAKFTGNYPADVSSIRIQKLALDKIFLKTKDQAFDLYIYTPPVYTYVWDHMLHWYAKSKYENFPQDYGYQRGANAKNDFYLLIEPDLYQDRIQGWKGNFETFGKPIKSWQLPADLVLEKWKANSND